MFDNYHSVNHVLIAVNIIILNCKFVKYMIPVNKSKVLLLCGKHFLTTNQFLVLQETKGTVDLIVESI
jgi:hypothetical protein